MPLRRAGIQVHFRCATSLWKRFSQHNVLLSFASDQNSRVECNPFRAVAGGESLGFPVVR